MQRISKYFTVENAAVFKEKLMQWAQNFEVFAYLDSNQEQNTYSKVDVVAAFGICTSIKADFNNAFEQLKYYQSTVNDYIFGYLSYDLKNDIEKLTSANFDGLHFPDLFFFQPKKLIFISRNTVEFRYLSHQNNEIEADFFAINSEVIKKITASKTNTIHIKKRLSKKDYLKKIEILLNHIHRGDCYEVNFCQEFYSENCEINPLKVFNNLNQRSKTPFATFLKFQQNFLISASPERFLQKNGLNVISQPIKGTIKRATIIKEDEKLIKQLAENPKERAENIMIVDLVRNDLARIANKGSVKVEELCKIYTFLQVHQLISTISCKVKNNLHPVDLIKNVYPMGSMTGAPKISAMKIIENLEITKRGLYSGALGYFTPNGDFDFNVVIRSILYNASQKYLSYSVGGAITALSNPEKEYEECLLKGIALKKSILQSK